MIYIIKRDFENACEKGQEADIVVLGLVKVRIKNIHGSCLK